RGQWVHVQRYPTGQHTRGIPRAREFTLSRGEARCTAGCRRTGYTYSTAAAAIATSGPSAGRRPGPPPCCGHIARADVALCTGNWHTLHLKRCAALGSELTTYGTHSEQNRLLDVNATLRLNRAKWDENVIRRAMMGGPEERLEGSRRCSVGGEFHTEISM
ncbi:Hypothetical predicted protein, partial [Olea europaea subsp. europaea]